MLVCSQAQSRHPVTKSQTQTLQQKKRRMKMPKPQHSLLHQHRHRHLQEEEEACQQGIDIQMPPVRVRTHFALLSDHLSHRGPSVSASTHFSSDDPRNAKI